MNVSVDRLNAQLKAAEVENEKLKQSLLDVKPARVTSDATFRVAEPSIEGAKSSRRGMQPQDYKLVKNISSEVSFELCC